MFYDFLDRHPLKTLFILVFSLGLVYSLYFKYASSQNLVRVAFEVDSFNQLTSYQVMLDSNHLISTHSAKSRTFNDDGTTTIVLELDKTLLESASSLMVRACSRYRENQCSPWSAPMVLGVIK